MAIFFFLTFGATLIFLKLRPERKEPVLISPLTPVYQFDYQSGKNFWENYPDLQVNTSYEAVIRESRYLAGQKCTEAGIEKEIEGKDWICLLGEGEKMIVPFLATNVSYLIFESPQKGGFWEQKTLIQTYPRHFFQAGKKSEAKFFVVDFAGRPVPTYFPAEAKNYLPVWQKAFLEINGTDGEYFKNHFFIVGAGVKITGSGKKLKKHFEVNYYFKLDWAQLELKDSFVFGMTGYEAGVSVGGLVRDFELPVEKTKYNQPVEIHRFKSAETIVSEDTVVAKIEAFLRNPRGGLAPTIFRFDVNRDLALMPDGRLVLFLHGGLDKETNRCLVGTMLLEEAEIIGINEVPCRIVSGAG